MTGLCPLCRGDFEKMRDRSHRLDRGECPILIAQR